MSILRRALFRLFWLMLPLVVAATESAPHRPVLLFVHGAWGGAWQFSKVEPLLR